MTMLIWAPGKRPGPANQPPSVPASLAASNIEDRSLTISWAASTDDVAVLGYEYRVDAGFPVDVDLATSVTITLLEPSTQYAFQVRAYDAHGFSAWSTAILATTAASTNQPPSFPTNLAVSNIAATGLTLTWDAATDDVAVTGYEYRIGTGTPVDVGNVLTAAVTGLESETAYEFQVRAYDGEGAFSSWSTAAQATTAAPPNQAPSTPANLAASNLADTSLTLTWDAATDDVAVTGYEYRIGTTTPVDVGNVLTAFVSGLIAGTQYSFQVRAYDGQGAFSSWSAAITATTTGATDFDTQWAQQTAAMDVVFDMDPAGYADGALTVGTFNDQYPGQMNDWKNHLEGTRGPLLVVGDQAGRKMIELYRPKYLSGESTDVWFRKILGQSHPNPLFPQLGVGGDTIRHQYSFYFPLHALQGGGPRGHICPKTVKMVGGPQGVTGVGNTGENPQPAGMYEFVPTIYNHKPYYSTPNAKGDWRNTIWDVNGDYGPAVTLDPSSYQTLTHFGIATYLYDPRSAVVGHPFQEMLYILYWDENTQQLTNVRRPFKPDTLYDIRMEVVLNTRTEISPGVYNNGNNDGILRVWVREDNGPWLLGREELDLNIRGNGINTDYHPTEPVPFGDAGFIDFTGGSGFSYNLVPDSGLVDESTDSWFWFGGINMWVS